MNEYDNLKLFSNCKLVKGVRRSIIYDLQRNEYFFVSNELFDILQSLNEGVLLKDIKSSFNIESQQILDQYISSLLENEILFVCNKDSFEYFPEIDTTFKSPTLLENCIIDIKSHSNHNYPKIFNELSYYLLRSIELRFFDLINIDYLINILNMIHDCDIKTIQLIIPYQTDFTPEYIKNLTKRFPKIIIITLFNSLESHTSENLQATITYLTENITSEDDCGLISKHSFSCNLKLYIESQEYNTCLNKKISIDSDGFIKNCPSMPNHFGHHYDLSIHDVMNNPNFSKLWRKHKGLIQICKECEFRHMCTDCRAFIKNNNINSQPAKCTYNPYVSKWINEEGYCPVEEFINNNAISL